MLTMILTIFAIWLSVAVVVGLALARFMGRTEAAYREAMHGPAPAAHHRESARAATSTSETNKVSLQA